MKDPLHKEETAYDVLGLQPNASKKDILNALPNFIKNPKNRSRITFAQEARKQLMDIERRLAIDILYYQTGWFTEYIDKAGQFDSKDLEEFLKAEIIDDQNLYFDLRDPSGLKPERPFEFSTMKLMSVKFADGNQKVKLYGD